MMMKIKPWKLMKRKDKKRERIMNTLPEEIKSFKQNQDPRESSHIFNSYVTRWDTLQEIVHSKHNNSRREIRSSMPMQMKMMTQLKRRTMKMKTLVKNMF